MSGNRTISTTTRLFFLQGKAPKEIHAILPETLACFLPVRAKDLSVPLYTCFVSLKALYEQGIWALADLNIHFYEWRNTIFSHGTGVDGCIK